MSAVRQFIAGMLAIAVLVILLLGFFRWRLGSRMLAPGDLPELVAPEHRTAPDALAGAALLQAAAVAATIPVGAGASQVGMPPTDVRRRVAAGQPGADVLQQLDQVWAGPGLSLPRVPPGATVPLPVAGLLRLGELGLVRAWDRAARHPADGVDAFLALILGWDRVAAADVPFALADLAISQSDEALAELEELLERAGPVQPALWRRASLGLGPAPGADLHLAGALVRDCADTADQLDALAQQPEGFDRFRGYLLPTALLPVAYSAPHARVWHLKRCYDYLEALSWPAFRREWPAPASLWPKRLLLHPGALVHWPYSRIAVDVLDRLEAEPFQREEAARARRAGLQALWAARWYRRSHGRAPDQLAQLVPDPLPAIPADIYGLSTWELADGELRSQGDGRVMVRGIAVPLRWPIDPR